MTQIVDPSIFLPPPPPPAPPDPNVVMLNQYMNQMQGNLARDMALFYKIAAFFWNNPNGLPPQQAFNLVSTGAVSLMQLCNAYTTFMSQYTGSTFTVVPTGWMLTPNSDGTITAAFNSTGS
jgi:hypothetical protein